MTVTAFFNELLQCYQMFVAFLFSYTLSGIPVGYLIAACCILAAIVRYILGGIR